MKHQRYSGLLQVGPSKARLCGFAGFGFGLALFEHAGDHLNHYQALAGGHGSAVAFGSIQEMQSDLVRNELGPSGELASSTAIPRDVTAQFIVGVFMVVLAWWLDGGAKLPPKSIDAMFRRLVTGGVRMTAQLENAVSE